MQPGFLKRAVLTASLFAALSLLTVPLVTWLFTEYAQPTLDARYERNLLRSIERNPRLSASDKEEAREFVRAHPASQACHDGSPEVAGYRQTVCDRYSELWQYDLVNRVAWWSLVGGVLVLLAIYAIGALAFFDRGAQYVSLVVGWNLLRVTSAAQILVHGALLVWLSYWVTAFFFERFFVKLVGFAAILVGAAALHAIAGIFRKPPPDPPLPGRLIEENDAPQLWEHLRRCAKHLSTAPPKHLIAGIDANFFVTEAPLTVGDRELTGRSLYVSLPLLRVLDRAEADAVLVHELAHFRGGDTASSARLGPKLLEFDQYCQLMAHGGVTIVCFHVMNLYRLMFEIALQSDSRQREFRADRVAAKVISPEAISRSLVKIAAYSMYRSGLEQQLFEQDSRHDGALGLAARIFAGLAPYASSRQFIDVMETANVPHPFDSHPPLGERMRNVGHEIAERDFAAVVTSKPRGCWIDDIRVAGDVEAALWSEYESQFAHAHEESLAYRYLPANDAERAIVLRYFPGARFELRRGRHMEITYEGLRLPDSDFVSWDEVADFEYENGFGADILKIKLTEKGLLGKKTRKVKLPGIKKRREEFQLTLGHYWNRHRAMRESIPL